MAGVQGPLKGPGSSRVLDVFSWYLRLIVKHSNEKFILKSTSDQNFEGVRACCNPAWIRHWIICVDLQVQAYSFDSFDWGGGGGVRDPLIHPPDWLLSW